MGRKKKSGGRPKKNGSSAPKKKAPTYLSGGGGFNFEDAVAAHFMALMLLEREPLGSNFGPIARIQWQGTDCGWLLDDLVLTGDTGCETGVSVKSDSHLNTAGFSQDFSERCWQQSRKTSPRQFGADRDLLSLVLGVISTQAQRAWQLLSSQLQTASVERIEQRLTEPPVADDQTSSEGTQSSQLQRTIVEKFLSYAGDSQTTTKATKQDALRLLKQVRVFHFDFLETPSQMEDAAIQSLQVLVESGKREDAKLLWNELLKIAKDFRPTGGNLTREELRIRLQTKYKLAALPDYSNSLSFWKSISEERLRNAKWGFAPEIDAMPRDGVWEAWDIAVNKNLPIVAVGPSGAGKTSFVREFARRSALRVFLLDNALLSVGGALHGVRLTGWSRPLIDLLKAVGSPSLLLVDATEKFSSNDLENVISLISAAKPLTEAGHLKIVLTCQPSGYDRLRIAFNRESVEIESIAIPVPSNREVVVSVERDPQMTALVAQQRLKSLFSNLKVVELIWRAIKSGIAFDSLGNLKATGVLNVLWNEWVEQQGQKLGRSRLLQRLGIEDSETLTAGHAILQLESTEMDILPSLIDDGLLLRFEERVYFAHDFVADFSRFRVLLSLSASDWLARAASFQWHNAMILLSQHLAEDSSDRWLAAFSEILRASQPTSEVCSQLFIDGMILAIDSTPALLTQIWPKLLVLGNQYTKLLLERVAIAGTKPDEKWFGDFVPKFFFRPGPWRSCETAVIAAVLEMLVADSAMNSELVPSIIAICDMVLRRKIIVGDVSESTSLSAAQLACRIADWLITHFAKSYEYHGEREEIYRAMLLAASVKPDEVGQLALRLAQRIPESADESVDTDAVAEFQSAEPELDLFDLIDTDPNEEKATVTWPDGPLRSVDDSFRDVCLDTELLMPLIDARPAIAKEVILACCIEEPRLHRHRGFYDDDEIGMVDRHNRQPPLFDVGPFLHFFRKSPDDALSILLHLCNFSTEQWYESPARQKLEQDSGSRFIRKLGPFAVTVPARDGSTTVWKGSSNIYRWSLGGLPSCEIITNILMAFEFWIYEEIAKGNDVNKYLSRIVADGTSVGLAGCLIDIGKRYPELFQGALMPLLGCWVFYGWDRVVRLEREGGSEGLIGWGFARDRQRKMLAIHWHKAEHRKMDLTEFAKNLFVENNEFRVFMESSRKIWEQDFDEEWVLHGLKDLACLFDWSNYSVEKTEDSGEVVTYHPPEERRREAEARLQDANDTQLVLTLPMRCRNLLDSQTAISKVGIDNLWNAVQRIESLPEKQGPEEPFADDEWSRKQDALTAAAASMLYLGNGHLSNEMTAFCRKRFEEIVAEEPQRRRYDVPEALGNHSWDYFFADMTIEYLIRDLNDAQARSGVGYCVNAFHYGALSHFMNGAFRLRSKLGELFSLLAGYVITRSSLEERSRRVFETLSRYDEWLRSPHRKEDLKPEEQSKYDAMKAEGDRLAQEWQTFSDAIAAWSPVGAVWETASSTSLEWLKRATSVTGTRLVYPPKGDEYDIKHADIGLDLFVLEHGFDWIDVSLATDGIELNDWIGQLAGLLRIQGQLIPILGAGQSFATHGYGHKFDQFVHLLLARNMIRGCRIDLSALWMEKLSQVSVAPDHVTTFLNLFCALAGDEQPPPNVFVGLWMAMLRYANDSSIWNQNSQDIGDAWVSLLGMNFRGFPEDWVKQVTDALRSQTELVCECLTTALNDRSCAGELVASLCQEVWEGARLKLVEVFAAVFERFDNSEFPAEQICDFLELCWTTDSRQITTNRQCQTAFTGLLNRVVACGCVAGNRLVFAIEKSKSRE